MAEIRIEGMASAPAGAYWRVESRRNYAYLFLFVPGEREVQVWLDDLSDDTIVKASEKAMEVRISNRRYDALKDDGYINVNPQKVRPQPTPVRT